MEMPITFERDLYRAVIRFKQAHPGALEERTKRRNGGETDGKQVCEFVPGRSGEHHPVKRRRTK